MLLLLWEIHLIKLRYCIGNATGLRMGGLRGIEEKISVTEDPPHLHQTVPQTATPVWNESAAFLIRKPNTESLELQVP